MVEQCERVLITWSEPHPEHNGRDLAEVAREWNLGIRETIVRLTRAGAVYFHMAEDDVRRIVAYPQTMFGSDGIPSGARPHPRLWGTFPRVLGHYSRELRLMPLETAVHKMTGLAAQTFQLKDRGRIAEGAFADLVLFNPREVIDRATYDNPEQRAAGIELVAINGAVILEQGRISEHRSGRVLRRVHLASRRL
jgi:N-acyl-D-amino-acid deacylase